MHLYYKSFYLVKLIIIIIIIMKVSHEKREKSECEIFKTRLVPSADDNLA